ncbi:MAG: oligosaccharide flippase family protein [Alphaproteobacteria bacterium]
MAKPAFLTAMRHVGWAGIEVVSSVLVSLLALLGIARLIGATEFGLGVLALGITQILGVVLGSLFHDALVRHPDLTRRHFDLAWTATLLLSIVACVICLIIAEPLAHYFRETRFVPVFLTLALVLVPESLIAPLIAERRRELDFRLVTVQFLIARAVGALAGLVCAAFGLGVWSMVCQQWITAVVGLIILLAKSPYRPRFAGAFADLLPMLRFTSSIIATQFVIQFAQRLLLIYIARIGDLTLAGYWGLADRLIDAVQRTVTNALYHVSLSHFSKVQDDHRRLGELVRQANIWFAGIVFPGLALICVAGPEIIRFLVGDGWGPAGPAVQVLALGVMVQLRRLMDHVALNALGRSDVALLAYGAEAALALLALVAFGPVTLVAIALIRALQPIAGDVIIIAQSIRLTERRVDTELLDVVRDLLFVVVITGAIWWLHHQVGAHHGVLYQLIASTLGTLPVALAAFTLLRPALTASLFSMAAERLRTQ